MNLAKLNPNQFDKFRAFIYRKCGIKIDEKKITMLSNRIRRRLKAGSFEDFDAYYRFLTSKAGQQELEYFFDVVTTHETSFFRTPTQFEWLRQDFVKLLVEQHQAGQRAAEIKLWSAGCSNGAEAYSMAICLLGNAYRLRDWKLDILGTDISRENILDAREGNYPERALQLVPEEGRRRWLRAQRDGRWAVQPSLLEIVRFHQHNLLEPLAEANFDCVFIRNVLIYFDAESKRQAVTHLLSSLNVGGYLVVGPSEGIQDLLGALERVSPLIYRKLPTTNAGVRPDPAGAARNSNRFSLGDRLP